MQKLQFKKRLAIEKGTFVQTVGGCLLTGQVKCLPGAADSQQHLNMSHPSFFQKMHTRRHVLVGVDANQSTLL